MDDVYGGLNEYVPHKLMNFNTWSPVGGAVWEGIGGIASLKEEPCHWGRFGEFNTLPCSHFSLLHACSEGREPSAPAPAHHACCLLAMIDYYPSVAIILNKLFLLFIYS